MELFNVKNTQMFKHKFEKLKAKRKWHVIEEKKSIMHTHLEQKNLELPIFL
jgi:D-lyxose ketol-isomerase